MKKTILLTGASGFVGRQVYKQLQNHDLNIVIVSRKKSLAKIADLNKNTKVILSENLFRESLSWWETALQNVDIIIHCAWYAEPGLYLHSEKNFECLTGTLNIANVGSKIGIKKFVGIGSCFEYDLTGSGILSIGSPLNPKTLYACTKVSVFYILGALFSSRNIDFAWCRLFYLYGDGEDSRRLFPYLHHKISNGEIAELTSGNQIRDYINIEYASAYIAEISFGNKTGAINICSGHGKTIRSIAEGIANQYGRLDLLKFDVRDDNLVDPPIIVGIPN
jgi:nucleoside-diphosphate-sugar epimerase